MSCLLNRKNVIYVSNFLNKINKNIKLIELDKTARTAQEASDSLNQAVGSIIKSLLFKTQNKEFYLCLVSGDKFVSIDKLTSLTNKIIIKANADDVKKQTGFSIGGVTPGIAHINSPTEIFIDLNLNRFDKIYGAAGHSHIVFGISFEELCEITKAKICDIVD